MIVHAVLAAEVLVGGILLPTAEYDYPPRMQVQVMEGTSAEIDRLCRRVAQYDGDRRYLACAMKTDDLCLIIWPKGMPRSGALWRHENAHCNGWRH